MYEINYDYSKHTIYAYMHTYRKQDKTYYYYDFYYNYSKETYTYRVTVNYINNYNNIYYYYNKTN